MSNRNNFLLFTADTDLLIQSISIHVDGSHPFLLTTKFQNYNLLSPISHAVLEAIGLSD